MNNETVSLVVDREVDGRKSIGHLVASVGEGQNARSLLAIALNQFGVALFPSLHSESKL